MAARIRFHPDAEDEYVAAVQWYEERVRGLGRRFEDEVDKALSTAAEAPGRWPVEGQGCRRVLLRRFPYRLVYLLEDEDLWVVALAHQRRRPAYWVGRLG